MCIQIVDSTVCVCFGGLLYHPNYTCQTQINYKIIYVVSQFPFCSRISHFSLLCLCCVSFLRIIIQYQFSLCDLFIIIVCSQLNVDQEHCFDVFSFVWFKISPISPTANTHLNQLYKNEYVLICMNIQNENHKFVIYIYIGFVSMKYAHHRNHNC